MKLEIDGTTYHTTQKLLQPGLVGQLVQEKFEEENMAVFQNTQTAGFYAQSCCEPTIHGAGHARTNLDYSSVILKVDRMFALNF